MREFLQLSNKKFKAMVLTYFFKLPKKWEVLWDLCG